jgi:hypothetical protein
MLTRRAFTAFSCCSAHSALAPRRAEAQTNDWICGTASIIEQDASLAPMGADPSLSPGRLEEVQREFKLTPFGTGRTRDRWRRSDGLTPNTGLITLGVHFLNGTEQQKDLVRRSASLWTQGDLASLVAFRFDVPRSRAQITVNLESDRNNSIVGRASADYAQSQATMNLVSMYAHVIAHEFGHALGLQHEHQNPNVVIVWNRPAVIADMAKQGWTEAMVESNIFTRLGSDYACVGDPDMNPASIMLYPVPRHWTQNGFTSGTNAEVSSRDYRCLSGIYRA